MTETLRVDGLEFAVVRIPRRKTVGITVERDGGLSVAAPVALDAARVEPVVRGKLLWVYTKLAEQSLLFRQAAPREYVSGEGFHYLGRSYRLLLTEPANGEPVQLRLTGGRFPGRRRTSRSPTPVRLRRRANPFPPTRRRERATPDGE